MSCKLSEKCDNVFACNVLRPEVELLGCNFYKPKKPMTNEEWLRQCNTEQLARWIAEEKLCRGYFIFPSMEEAIQDALEWLKQPHTKGDSE